MRPCPLCNGTGHIEGPIHRPPPRAINTRQRTPPPQTPHIQPPDPYAATIQRLRRLADALEGAPQ